MLLPSRQGLAYQPQLHEVSLCLWETLALEITYVVDVITHCHCVRIVVILSARYCIGTIHSYGNLLNLESPSGGLLRYCLPPNEGTRLSRRRNVANFLSATSRTVLTIYVFFLLHRYLLDVTLPLAGTSPYTRSCHCCCPVVYSYINTWNMLAGTWVLKENTKLKLQVFERKVLRRIYGPTKGNDGTWRIKSN